MENGGRSAWTAEIPWQEGTDADFADFKEEMAKAKDHTRQDDETSSSSQSEEEDKPTRRTSAVLEIAETGEQPTFTEDGALEVDTVNKKFEEYNKMVDTETEEEDDPAEEEDPGEDKPEIRILWAAQFNKLDIAKEMLLGKPGLVKARDEDLYTPLHRACYNGHIEMARLLLETGADFMATTDTGWTPLHSAAKWNNVGCAELMLNAGVPVNTVSEGGLTPLHVASMSYNCRDVVELLLLQPGVDLTLTSNQGDTALEIAERTGPLGPLFQTAAPRSIQKYRKL